MRYRNCCVRFVALMAPLALVAAACGSDDSAPAADSSVQSTDEAGSTDDAVGEPLSGGDLVLARPADIKDLDPLPTVETESLYTQLMMMETLMKTSPSGEVVPHLAESLTPGDDGLTWTVVLREGTTFSDGTPLTASDVEFSLERVTANLDLGFAYLLAPISEVNVIDDLSLELVTSEPVSYLPALLSVWTGAIIPTDFGGLTEDEFFEAPVGTGPFVFESWTPGQEIKLVKNDAYWQEGKPYLDSVTWTQVSDDNARVLQLQGDQADIAGSLPFSAIAQLEGAEEISLEEYNSTLQYFLMFNTTVAPFDEVEVRRAIAMALDKESMVQAALFGRGATACSILPPSMAYYSSETDCLTFDLDAAAAELASSSVPDGFETSILIAGDNVSATSIAEIVVANLAEIGIDVAIEQVDQSQLYETSTTGDYEMIYQGWGSDIPDPDQQLTFMLDPGVGAAESYWTFYDNPELVDLLSQARSEFDNSARASLYAEIQDIHAAEVPHVPLVFQPILYANNDSVQDFEVLPTGNYFLQDVWIEE